MDYKKWILREMTRYYGGNKRKAMLWYVRNHPHLTKNELKKKSPKKLVEEGNGQEVVDFIKLVLDV